MIYWQLLGVYLKIGIFGFGGGYAMLSLIQYEVVDKYHWLTLQEFTDVVAISQMTPGPIGINSATYIGYTATGSVWGSVIATFAVCLPSFLLVLLISFFYAKFKNNKYVAAAFTGLRPMTVGLIGALSCGRHALAYGLGIFTQSWEKSADACGSPCGDSDAGCGDGDSFFDETPSHGAAAPGRVAGASPVIRHAAVSA